MPTANVYEYAIIRVVPRVERSEFINAGVILFCRTQRFLDARIALNTDRLVALAPYIDPAPIQQHVAIIPRICKGGNQGGPIGLLPMPERFHWLVAPRSTIIQTSPIHSGLCTDTTAMLQHLLDTIVIGH